MRRALGSAAVAAAVAVGACLGVIGEDETLGPSGGGTGGSSASTTATGSSTTTTSSGHGGSSGSGGSTANGGSGGEPASGGSPATGGEAGEGGCTSFVPPPLDLDEVTWLHPDVSDWPVTVDLSEVAFQGGLICLYHDIASQSPPWPTRFISGTEVIANPWVFIYESGQWYGATWEWLRPPGQQCKNRSSVAGDHIKQPPFDASSGWRPRCGQTLYFMVSGLARAGLSNVQQRSNPVQVIWPE